MPNSDKYISKNNIYTYIYRYIYIKNMDKQELSIS